MSDIQKALSDLRSSWKIEKNKLEQKKVEHDQVKFNWPLFIAICAVLFLFIGPGSVIAAFIAIKIMEIVSNKNLPAIVSNSSQLEAVEKICSLSEGILKELSPARKFVAIKVLQKAKATLVNTKIRLEGIESSSAIGGRAAVALQEVNAGVSAAHILSSYLESDINCIRSALERELLEAEENTSYLYFRRLLEDDSHMQEALISGLISKDERFSHLQELNSARSANCCNAKACILPKSKDGQCCIMHSCMNAGCSQPVMRYSKVSPAMSATISGVLNAAEKIGYNFSVKPNDLESYICGDHYDEAMSFLNVRIEKSLWNSM